MYGTSTTGFGASSPGPSIPISGKIRKIRPNKIQGSVIRGIVPLARVSVEEIDNYTNLNNFIAINGPITVDEKVRMVMKGPGNSKLVFVKGGDAASATVQPEDLFAGVSYGATTGTASDVLPQYYIKGISGTLGEGTVGTEVYTRNLLGT